MDISQSAQPVRLNARQEAFAQAIAAGAASSREAYCKAYGKKVPDPSVSSALDASACNLLKNPKVDARIAQIKAQNAAATLVSVQSVTKMLVDAYELAQRTKQASAAAQAAMGIAKLHGLITDRSLVEATVRKPSESPDSESEMTEDQWMKEFGAPSVDPNRSLSPSPDPDPSLN